MLCDGLEQNAENAAGTENKTGWQGIGAFWFRKQPTAD